MEEHEIRETSSANRQVAADSERTLAFETLNQKHYLAAADTTGKANTKTSPNTLLGLELENAHTRSKAAWLCRDKDTGDSCPPHPIWALLSTILCKQYAGNIWPDGRLIQNCHFRPKLFGQKLGERGTQYCLGSL